MNEVATVRKADEGFALFAVLGAIALMTAVAMGGYYLASQSVTDSSRNEKESAAFQVASSGMDRELATFAPSSKTYPYTNSINGGSYSVSVAQNDSFSWTITSTGTAGGAVETVKMKFFYVPSLWEIQMQVGNNPDAPFGSAAAWNGGATIQGPLYVNGNFEPNSNLDFQLGGPLFVHGKFAPKGGVSFDPQPFTVYCSEPIASPPSGVVVVNSCPDLSLPWMDANYWSSAINRAKGESSDNIMGPPQTIANAEVATTGNPTYTYARPAGFNTTNNHYYKVFAPGGATPVASATNAGTTNLVIGGTGSFGKLPGVKGGSPRGDFAWDDAENVLYIDGTVYVDGDVTFNDPVKYVGNGTIVANGDITINGSDFVPYNTSLNINECVGLAAGNNVTSAAGNTRCIVFANQTYSFDGKSSEFHGIMHANLIDAGNGSTKPLMEPENFDITMLPNSMPGGVGDPRGGSYAAQGIISRGTWSRR